MNESTDEAVPITFLHFAFPCFFHAALYTA